MNNFVIRTEELEDSQLKELYVETENDNDILNRLKSQSPVLLVGSRGMGKSFLFKISQMQLLENFQKDRIFPVFLTFRSASVNTDELVHTARSSSACFPVFQCTLSAA